MTYFAALKVRAFALLWAGQTISRVGDQLYQVALAWWVLEQTGSVAVMGTTLVCSMLPMLVFVLLGGVFVDRMPRMLLMLISDLARGVIGMCQALVRQISTTFREQSYSYQWQSAPPLAQSPARTMVD